MEKLPWSDYLEFIGWKHNEYKNRGLRYGQAFIAFCSTVKGVSITDSELFYCNDSEKCITMIFEKYVKMEGK